MDFGGLKTWDHEDEHDFSIAMADTLDLPWPDIAIESWKTTATGVRLNFLVDTGDVPLVDKDFSQILAKKGHFQSDFPKQLAANGLKVRWAAVRQTIAQLQSQTACTGQMVRHSNMRDCNFAI
jgi:hypothetical protein